MFVSLLALYGCENVASELFYDRTGVDSVLDIGEMRVIETEEYWQTYLDNGAISGGYGVPGTDPSKLSTDVDTWYELVQGLTTADSKDRVGIYYGQLGAGDPGTYGGATLTFRGTGSKVCVVVDPESVFWNQQVSEDVTSKEYIYEDRLDDDGDLDMYAGLSAYYTGDPGTKMGSFEVPYLDPSGQTVNIAFDECARVNNGIEVHSGRAFPEYCEIDTTNTQGKLYTVALDTFALPINDSILSFGVGLFEVGDGGCLGSGSTGGETAHPPIDGATTECVLPAEWSGGVPDGSPNPIGPAGGCDQQDGTWTWECLEREYCTGKASDLNNYCAAHLDDENSPCVANDFTPTDTGA